MFQRFTTSNHTNTYNYSNFWISFDIKVCSITSQAARNCWGSRVMELSGSYLFKISSNRKSLTTMCWSRTIMGSFFRRGLGSMAGLPRSSVVFPTLSMGPWTTLKFGLLALMSSMIRKNSNSTGTSWKKNHWPWGSLKHKVLSNIDSTGIFF